MLDALVDAGHEIAAVYCQPPRPAGRGKKDRPTSVHARATELGFEVRTPESLKNEQASFSALNADVAVVVAYGLILPQSILDAPRLGCLNIHASLLPRWRGAAPIHRAIMAGDAQTGVCIMQMEAGLDTGPVLLRDVTDIGATETTGALHDRLSEMGATLIVEALTRHESLTPEPQPPDGVTYAEKIDKAEALVDWTASADAVDHKIRGLSPFPGAWSEVGGHRVKFLASQVAGGQGVPGQVLDDTLKVACGTGAVDLLRLQRAGKGPQDKADFLRGLPLPPGTQFGEG
ncbi:MAG: methionyl-tRNA formyltransferase [Pseudomonadota bacterium]